MTRIQRLPEGTRSSIRSGVVVCDLTRIVEELVYNSIDAGATKVSVAVGISSCYVKVADNGSGITREGLMLLGERYATSKFDHLAMRDAGNESCEFHGESLMSISDISSLEIMTKARGKPNGYRKVIKNCKCLYLGICDDEQTVGTTVTVRDIFYNQPVRQRQLKSSCKKVLGLIKMSVLRVALVHVKVSFKVFDVESGDELLQTESSTSPLPLLSSNFGIEYSNTLYKLNVSDGELKLSGYVSGPHQILPLKELQYFYINSRFICKGPMHKLVNQLAAKFDEASTNFHCEKKNKLDLGPTFILNLKCPKYYYDLTNVERSRTSVEFKDWVPILSLIENGVIRIWTENIPHGTLRSGNDMVDIYDNVKKRRRKPHTSVELPSPELKELPRNYDNTSDWEETLFSYEQPSKKLCALKKLQHEVFTPAHRQVEASMFGKQEDDVVSSTYRNMLLTLDDDTDDILMPNRVSGNFHEFDYDQQFMPHPRKSFLRSCSHERSWHHEGSQPESDEIFEFKDDDIGMKTKWFEGVRRTKDKSEIAVCERDQTLQFKVSSIVDSVIDDRSILFTTDLVKSSSSLENVLFPESSERLLDGSSVPFLTSEGYPVTAKGFCIEHRVSDDDATNENISGGDFCFREDITNNYLDWREDEDSKCLDWDAEESWRRHYSFANISSNNRSSGYDSRQIGKFHSGKIQNLLSSTPLKESNEVGLSPLPSYGKRSPKNYSAPSLFDPQLAKHVCETPDGTKRQSKFDRDRWRKSIRSHSAPPFHKRKKRYLDLTNSSTLMSSESYSGNTDRIFSVEESSNGRNSHLHLARENPVCLQKPCLQLPQSPKERLAVDSKLVQRTSSEMTSKVIMVKDVKPIRRCQAVDTESDDRGDLKEFQDNSLRKWRSCSSPTVGRTLDNNETQNDIIDISGDVLHLTGYSLVPKLIDRNSLEDAKVLNQVDKKFIPVVAGKTLAIIDQHAADERIRLEELRQKVFGEMKTITYLNDEQILDLPEIGYQLLDHYGEQIKDWGWICNIHCNESTSFTKNLNFLHKQPTAVKLLAVPCILGVNLNDSDLFEFLRQLADTDGSSTMPPSVHRILNNKACRGAIMFGDTLLHSECSLIVDELKRTSLCFQCAHGRPTTVPLVSLNLLHDKIAKLGLNELTWHGLRRHKISVERTTQRLRSALS